MAGQATYDLVLHKDADPTTSGVAICGFSTVGMVGVIAASHICLLYTSDAADE